MKLHTLHIRFVKTFKTNGINDYFISSEIYMTAKVHYRPAYRKRKGQYTPHPFRSMGLYLPDGALPPVPTHDYPPEVRFLDQTLGKVKVRRWRNE